MTTLRNKKTRVRTLLGWRLAFAMLAAVTLMACSTVEKDGDWDPMVWKADMPVRATGGVYDVSADGATLVFSCRNYARPWFSDAMEDGEVRLPPYINNPEYPTIYGEHFEAAMHGNRLSVVFSPNDDDSARLTTITVTAGDVFYTFRFKQASK